MHCALIAYGARVSVRRARQLLDALRPYCIRRSGIGETHKAIVWFQIERDGGRGVGSWLLT